MLFLDDKERVKVTVRGIEWEIGPVPIGKLELLELALADARRPLVAAPEAEREAIVGRTFVALLPLYRELVRWGVKGWDKGKLAPAFAPETFAGQSHQVLDPKIVDALSRVAGGLLVADLASEVVKANHLSEDELLGFR